MRHPCRVALRAALVGLGLALAAPALAEEPAGTVTIEQVQVAFWGSGNLGGGTLTFRGETYGFTVGGLGIGGFGVSTMTATGDVYGLERVEDFEGAYVQGRYGAVAGAASAGELWLENDRGVTMRLAAKRQGLALSAGGDAVYIVLD